MEYIDKPVCDSCGGSEFAITEIEKPEPKTRYVQASQYFRPPNYETTSSFNFIPELTKKAVCVKCGREYLY